MKEHGVLPDSTLTELMAATGLSPQVTYKHIVPWSIPFQSQTELNQKIIALQEICTWAASLPAGSTVKVTHHFSHSESSRGDKSSPPNCVNPPKTLDDPPPPPPPYQMLPGGSGKRGTDNNNLLAVLKRYGHELFFTFSQQLVFPYLKF